MTQQRKKRGGGVKAGAEGTWFYFLDQSSVTSPSFTHIPQHNTDEQADSRRGIRGSAVTTEGSQIPTGGALRRQP